MAFRELMMIEVKEILRRWSAGHSERRTSRETGADRKTVRRYIAAAQSMKVEVGAEISDEIASQVLMLVQVQAPAGKSEEWRELASRRDRLEAWLCVDKPLRLSKVHVLLGREGVACSYATLRRYVSEELGWRKARGTVRLTDPPPGQEAQVDFGRLGMIDAKQGGRRRVVWALIVTLSHSRYQFVWPCFTQKTVDVVEGLEAAWRFFGGMPRTLVPDNMSTVVQRSDALSPVLTPAFADYVQVRGMFVDPARVRRPKDKARVENQVPYVRESFFEGETFEDIADVRRRAEQWCLETAGRRIHGTTRKQPREHYEAVEKAAMLPAPAAIYDLPVYTAAKVHPDHHIQVAHALYSVPTRYLHQEVTVRADRSLVKIYHRGQLIKTHVRVAAGERSTDANDYPSEKAGYAMRSVDAVLEQARKSGELVGKYAERLLSGPNPWQRMRHGYALLRLVERYGAERVNAVCASALAFDVVDVPRIGRMLKRATVTSENTTGDGKVVSLSLRFARPVEHFSTRDKKGGKS